MKVIKGFSVLVVVAIVALFSTVGRPQQTGGGQGAAGSVPNPLILAGIIDGQSPVTITTSAACTLGTVSGCNATAYSSGYTYNQEATAATAVVYTLPTPVAGKQYCVKNSYNGAAGDTGTLELIVANTGTQSIIYNGVKSASGFIQSGGALGDSACIVGISTTQWEAYVQVGTWTLH